MGLHDLAPELLRLILQQLDSPNDLVALTKGSSRCYRAFKIDTKQVLAAIIRREIQPDALPSALALANFSTKSSTEDQDLDVTRDFPDDTVSLMTMWRFHAEISTWVNLYATSAIELAKELTAENDEPEFDPVWATSDDNDSGSDGDIHSESDNLGTDTSGDNGWDEATDGLVPFSDSYHSADMWPCLSASERARFERAFYRFELYSRIRPSGPERVRRGDFGFPEEKEVLMQYGMFGEDWQPWENAELICIHNFFSQKMQERITKQNQMLTAAILASPGRKILEPRTILWGSGRLRLPTDDKTNDDEDLQHIRDLESHGMRLYADHGDRGQGHFWGSYLAVTGLRHMQRLLDASNIEFKTLVRADDPGWRWFRSDLNCLSLKNGGRYPGVGIWAGKIVSAEEEGIGDEEDGRRCGTLGYRLYPSMTDSAQGYPLHELASCFWDAERVRLPRVQQALQIGDNELGRRRRDEMDEPMYWPTERRCMGVLVTKEEFKRLQREFGCEGNTGTGS